MTTDANEETCVCGAQGLGIDSHRRTNQHDRMDEYDHGHGTDCNELLRSFSLQ